MTHRYDRKHKCDTMILPFVVLSLLVIQASLTPQVDSDVRLKYDELYYNVILGRFISAAKTTVELKNGGRGDVIRLVVNKLLAESQRNMVDYACKLYSIGETDIIQNYFPIQFSWLLMGEEVTFINLRDGMALKLAWGTDGDGDRGAFGDRDEWSNKRMGWKIIPHDSTSQKAYFEILNADFNQYLKLAIATDGDGEHKGFASDEHDSWRHQWYFHPVVVGQETVFYIINRKYNQPLKLGRYVDGDGDRRVWGHNGSPIGSPEYYAWYVRRHSSYV